MNAPLDELSSPQPPSLLSTWPGRFYALLGLALIIVLGFYFNGVLDNEMMGFTHDDGVYAITGQALALGKGFKLLHVVGEPPQVKYPIFYPFILSLVWRVLPKFPENLPAMNYVTLAFTLGACWLSFVWAKQCQKLPGWLALAITLLTASSFYFIYFFTSIMSEGPYLFFTMLTLWVFHQASQKQKPLHLSSVLALTLLSVLSFHTRVLALALMAAIGVWLLLNKQWRNALIYGTGCLLLGLLPWLLWTKLNTPAINDLNYPLVTAYSNYSAEFQHNFTTTDYLKGLSSDLFSLITRNLEVMFPLLPNYFKIYPKLARTMTEDGANLFTLGVLFSAYALVGMYVLQLISTLRQSLQNGKVHSQVFTVPGLYLFFYSLIIVLWNYDDQMARFLTPVLPLLWYYLFQPVSHLLPDFGKTIRAPRWKTALALIVTIALCLISIWPAQSSYRGIWTSRTQHWVESGKFRELWDDYKTSFQWMNTHLPKDAKLGLHSDTVFYLYTNRPTFYTFYASLRRKKGKFLPESYPLLMKSLDHYGVNYLVAEPHMQARTVRHPMNKIIERLLKLYPHRFQAVYTSPQTAIHIFKILPPKPGESYQTLNIPESESVIK